MKQKIMLKICTFNKKTCIFAINYKKMKIIYIYSSFTFAIGADRVILEKKQTIWPSMVMILHHQKSNYTTWE